MTKPLPESTQTSIATLDQAKAWIADLAAAGLAFHFEDDPGDIPCFDPADAPLIRARVAEMYVLDWGEIECPIGHLLDLESPGWRDA